MLLNAATTHDRRRNAEQQYSYMCLGHAADLGEGIAPLRTLCICILTPTTTGAQSDQAPILRWESRDVPPTDPYWPAVSCLSGPAHSPVHHSHHHPRSVRVQPNTGHRQPANRECRGCYPSRQLRRSGDCLLRRLRRACAACKGARSEVLGQRVNPGMDSGLCIATRLRACSGPAASG